MPAPIGHVEIQMFKSREVEVQQQTQGEGHLPFSRYKYHLAFNHLPAADLPMTLWVYITRRSAKSLDPEFKW